MYSDEDLAGGFEDLEEGASDDDSAMEGGYEDLEEAASDDDTANVTSTDSVEGADMPVADSAASAKAGAVSTAGGSSARYAIPSNEEIHGLKETGDLYMNNVFKLQLDEMLKYTHPSEKHTPPMEATMRQLQRLLQNLPSIQPMPLSQALEALKKRAGRNVQVPFCEPVPAQDPAYKFAFEPPSALNLVGSWPLKTAARRTGDMDVDVEVCMPSSLFQEKDTLNARYFYKRAFYLAVLAEAIHKARDELHLDVAYLDVAGDRRRTCLLLRPQKGKGAHDFSKLHAVIRVHLAHASDLFPVGRLAPNRNNLRGRFVGSADDDASTPTPLYNTCILQDELRLPHLVFLNATSEMCQHFSEACVLLKTWATQRGFGALHCKTLSRRMLAGTDDARFVLSMLLAHLLHGSPKGSASRYKLSSGMSSVQLFRGTLEFLAKQSFTTPVFMKAQPRFGLAATAVPPEAFSVFEYAFVDPSGSVNLLAHWPPSAVQAWQREAQHAMRMLNDSGDYFSELFLTTKCTPMEQCDDVARLQLQTKKLEALATHDAGSLRAAAVRRLLSVSSRALGQRATLLVVYVTSAQPYALTELASAPLRVELGLHLHAEHAFHQVEHGPPPESPDAPSFRAFWGEMAELRRFRDGRVLESVVWPVSDIVHRAALPLHILRFAWKRHACAKNVHFGSEPFQGMLTVPAALAKRAYLQDPSTQGFQLVQSAYDSLVRELRAMDELPLSVLSVSAVSSALRSMSPMIPGPVNLGGLGHTVPDVAAYVPVHDLLISLESSGQWPDDLAAIQEMKTALYERMADVLAKRIDGAVARVVYDYDATVKESIQDQTALQILLPSGFAFSLRIAHDREHVLLERLLRDKHARATATAALERYEARFVAAPAHHAALQTLQDRFPALGTTVRLVRRWLAAQGLAPHVPVEAAELLCVAVFLSPARTPPASAVHGWLAVMDLLARWDWREAPLLIPLEHATRLAHQRKAALSDDDQRTFRDVGVAVFPAAQRADAEQQFSALRARDPACKHTAWVLCTESDMTSKSWTRHRPNAMIADGVRQLAQRAVQACEQAMPLSVADAHALFTPSWDAYDFVLHLAPSAHMRYAEALAPSQEHWLAPSKKRGFANAADAPLRASVYGSEPRPGFDPMSELVQLISDVYPGICTLFYDDMGGTAIGGLWAIEAREVRDFKVRQGYSTRPVKEGVQLNRAAILAEMQRLGQGLITRVQAREL